MLVVYTSVQFGIPYHDSHTALENCSQKFGKLRILIPELTIVNLTSMYHVFYFRFSAFIRVHSVEQLVHAQRSLLWLNLYYPVRAVILQNIHWPTIKLPSPNHQSFNELPSHRLVSSVTIDTGGILLLKLHACSAMIWRYYVFARTCVMLRISKRNIGDILDV